MATTYIQGCKGAAGLLSYLTNSKGKQDRVKDIFSTFCADAEDLHGVENELQLSQGMKYDSLHFRIALSPDDRKLTKEESQQFITELTEKLYGNRNFYAVEHGDSASKNQHFHIVLSFLDDKKKCLNFSRQGAYKEAIRRQQITDEVCTKYNLSTVEREENTYNSTRNNQKISEIKMAQKGSYTWKNDLKNRIEKAQEKATDFSSFQQLLILQGVNVYERAGKLSYKFIDKGGKQRLIRSKNLGSNYMSFTSTKKQIVTKQKTISQSQQPQQTHSSNKNTNTGGATTKHGRVKATDNSEYSQQVADAINKVNADMEEMQQQAAQQAASSSNNR